MKINGRTLRASNADEHHLLRLVGVESLHIPRGENPFRVARKIEQLVKRQREEMAFLHRLARTNHHPREPQPSPGADLPHHEQDDAITA